MKILSVKKITSFIVETDDKDFPTFQRDTAGNWSQLMGESWESVYQQAQELETAYQKFIPSTTTMKTHTQHLNNEILNLISKSYSALADPRNHWHGRDTASGQALLINLSEFIADATSTTPEFVQNNYPNIRPFE